MADLVQTFAEMEWTGSADLLLPEDHCSAHRLPIVWTPRELAFELRFTPDCFLQDVLRKVEWRRSPYVPILLRNVVLEHGPWTLSVDEQKVSRINPLCEWPEGDWSDDSVGELRLRLQPVGAQRLDFELVGPGTHPTHWVLLQNWPQSMWLPSAVECPGHQPIMLSAGASGIFMGSDKLPVQGWGRVSTALELGWRRRSSADPRHALHLAANAAGRVRGLAIRSGDHGTG